MNRRGIAQVSVCLVVCLASLAGCGYKAGFLIPADVRSVNVKVASNQTFWREAVKVDNLEIARPTPTLEEIAAAELTGTVDELYEFEPPTISRPAYPLTVELSKQLKNEIVRRTPLKLAKASRADSILETTITDFEADVRVRGARDEVLTGTIRVTVDFVWKDRRTGRVIARGVGIRRPTDFVSPRGETFTTATSTSFRFIAERIVEGMQEGF